MAVTPIKDSFSALLYETRGAIRGRLVVHGVVQTPTPGWRPRVVKAHPQGINPAILLLDLDAQAPKGIVPEHVAKEDVAFVTLAGVHAYNEVSILNQNGDGLTLPVHITVDPHQ